MMTQHLLVTNKKNVLIYIYPLWVTQKDWKKVYIQEFIKNPFFKIDHTSSTNADAIRHFLLYK